MRKLVAVGISLVVIGAWAACGNPTTPAPSSSKTAPIPIGVHITGPASVAPNQTAAFTATELFTDGSTQDVTTQGHWLADAPDVLSVTGAGQVTAHSSGGETSLHVTFNGLSAAVRVLVLPSGTFLLFGTVSEGTFPITNASVTVISGTGAGLTSQQTNGLYRLYGVAGDIQIRATAPGFNDATVSLTVNANESQDISLTTVTPEPNIAGTYAMTLDADPTCQLPTEVMERHYTATITQTGLTFQVALSGATFVTKNGLGSSFAGHVADGQISYQLDDGYYNSSYPDLVESIADGKVFVAIGAGVLAQSGPNLAGTLNGTLMISPLPLETNPLIAQCYSNQHRVQLTAQTTAAHRIRR